MRRKSEHKDNLNLTIITRTQNRPVTLQRLADNLRQQTSQDFLWLVVNDAGNFAAVEEILNNYKASGGIAKHIYIETSKGRSFPLNVGLRSTKSEFILIIDDDDYLEKNCLETMKKRMLELPWLDAVAAHCQIVFEEIEGESVKFKGLGMSYKPALKDFRPESVFRLNPAPIHSIMAKRKTLLDLGGFREDIEYTEDWCLWFYFSLRHHFDVIPKVLCYYSQRKSAGIEYENTTNARQLGLHALYKEKWQKEFLYAKDLSSTIIANAYERYEYPLQVHQKSPNIIILLWRRIKKIVCSIKRVTHA